MLILKDTLDFTMDGASVVTLGKFDGLHRGHRALIDRVLSYADSHRVFGRPPRTVVCSFLISSEMLLTMEERRRMLRDLGIDCLVECPFVPYIITMEAERFVREILVGQMKAVHVVVGTDFRFGYGRRGDSALLEELGPELGFTVETVPKVREGGEDISSTRVRKALAEGNMELAERLLGYTFFADGQVIHGRQIGRTIGFPTTNMLPGLGKLLPPNGVYAVHARVADRCYCGVTNIGTKPTVDGHFLGIETYLCDCPPEEDLYGEEQRVELLHFMRPERAFPSVEALREQIGKDRDAGERYFRERGELPREKTPAEQP